MGVLSDLASSLWTLLKMGWEWFRGMFRRVVGVFSGHSEAPTQAIDAAAPATTVPAAPAPAAPAPALLSDAAGGTDDNTALARMMTSEAKYPASVVVGWITKVRAAANKKSIYQFVTKGLGYGPQDRRKQGQGVVYASTAKEPSEQNIKLANGIISGTVLPSEAIRSHKPGSWVERDQGEPDDKIIKLQSQWKEGIYAQIANSKWILYSSDSPVIQIPDGRTAKQVLDSLPIVPAIDNTQVQANA